MSTKRTGRDPNSPQKPRHPIDEALRKFGWRRSTFDELTNKKVPLRLITRPIGTSRPMVMVVDINAWRDERLVYCELVTPSNVSVSDFLSLFGQMIYAGLSGESPIAYGMTPCNCQGLLGAPRWNPMVVPLMWTQGMDDLSRFNLILQYYVRLLRRKEWQCIDQSQLI